MKNILKLIKAEEQEVIYEDYDSAFKALTEHYHQHEIKNLNKYFYVLKDFERYRELIQMKCSCGFVVNFKHM